MEITTEIAAKVLDTVDAGLVRGIGRPIPGQMCVEAAVCYAMGLPHGDEPTCVARALRALKIRLNDSIWPSPTARAKGMRRLALAQLGSAGALDDVQFAQRVVVLTVRTVLPPLLRGVGLGDSAAACEGATTFDAAFDAAANASDATDAAARVAHAVAHAAAHAAARAAAYAAFDAAHAAANAIEGVTDAAAYAAANAAEGAAGVTDAAARAAITYATYAVEGATDAAAYAVDAVEGATHALLSDFAEGVVQILVDMGVPGVRWLSLTEGNKS